MATDCITVTETCNAAGCMGGDALWMGRYVACARCEGLGQVKRRLPLEESDPHDRPPGMFPWRHQRRSVVPLKPRPCPSDAGDPLPF